MHKHFLHYVRVVKCGSDSVMLASLRMFAALKFLWDTLIQTLRSSQRQSRQRMAPSIQLS